MPFTPFHIGISGTISFKLARYCNVAIFILANFFIDLEPLAVMVFNVSVYPLHGYLHSIIGATIVGAILGWAGWFFRQSLTVICKEYLKIQYTDSKTVLILSGIAGALFHVLLDSPLYSDIKPFYPLMYNPLYGAVSEKVIYIGCSLAFVPFFILYYNTSKNRGISD